MPNVTAIIDDIAVGNWTGMTWPTRLSIPRNVAKLQILRMQRLALHMLITLVSLRESRLYEQELYRHAFPSFAKSSQSS